MHHMWTFPDRIAGDGLRYLLTIFGKPSIVYLGGFGKICVSLFFFLTGYGLYLSQNKVKYDIVKKLKALYLSYWKVFLIFIPIAFLMFRNQGAYCENEAIYTCYDKFSWKTCITNFLGLGCEYNGEWWFFRHYLVALISFPFVRQYVDRFSMKMNIVWVVLASILITNVFPALGKIESLGNMQKNYLFSSIFCPKAPFFACFWMGIVCAKHGILDRIHCGLESNRLLNPLSDILLSITIVFLRQSGPGQNLDIFYTPVLIVVGMDLVKRLKYIRIALLEIGKRSTNMWLIHSFFCYYFYAVVKIVISPKYAVPALLILIVISYAASVIVDFIWNYLGKAKRWICCKVFPLSKANSKS